MSTTGVSPVEFGVVGGSSKPLSLDGRGQGEGLDGPQCHGRCNEQSDLSAAVAACQADAAFLSALGDLYARVDAAVAAGPGRCLGGGCCCRFDLMGHRLYVSTCELALLTQAPAPPGAPRLKLRCPYQRGPRCHARPRRPLGCRVFFCGQAVAAWSNHLYEQFHRQIRDLHDRCGIPYRYVEMTTAIEELWRSQK